LEKSASTCRSADPCGLQHWLLHTDTDRDEHDHQSDAHSHTRFGHPRKVSFLTQDKVRLSGLLYGQSKTVVICSNEYRSSQSDWSTIAPYLAKEGYMVLTYDYRGYGDSQGTFEGAKLTQDLISALSFARRLGANTIILMGASMGGTVTTKVAALEQHRIAAAVVISAPLGFQGDLDISDADLRAISAATFFINSNGDGFVYDIVHTYDEAHSPKQLYLYPGGAHGASLFYSQYGPDLSQRIVAFFQNYVITLR
jgi:pimeloyl-ACP methyl ester carboxylesterase